MVCAAAGRPARSPARRRAADAGSLPRHHRSRGRADRRARRAGASSARSSNTSRPRPRTGWPSAIEAAYEPPPDVRRDRIPINATVPAVDADRGARGAGPLSRRAHREGEGRRAGPVAGRRRGAGQRRSRAGADGAGRRQRRLDASTRPSRPPAALTADGAAGVPRAAVRDGARTGRAAAPGRRADRRRREHPQGRRSAARRARRAPPTSRCSRSRRWAAWRKLLDIAEQIDIPIVVSSALDSAVGIGAGLLAAAALPRPAACLRAGHRRAVRRGRRRARGAGRRVSARRAGHPGSGAAGGAGRAARAPAVVDRARHGRYRLRLE